MAGPTAHRLDAVRLELPRTGAMRVPGLVYASEGLLPDNPGDTLQQVANVATLPGIVEASYAMPDLHLGYGFCIGGVAATDVDAGGVVSPGGVGFDISCGVRVLTAPLTRDDLDDDQLETLMDRLGQAIPRGTGPGGIWNVGDAELQQLLVDGSLYAVKAGYGTEADLDHTEDRGRLPDADPDQISAKARKRGLKQVGSLGAGNHFLEVGVVDAVFDESAAEAFGLAPDQLTVTIHCGSRGLGHQACTDHVNAMQQAMSRYGIELPDKQLASVPVDSPEGRAYFGAMAAAANYGRANRQVLAEAARDAFAAAVGTRDLPLLYDVSHNMAKLEEHDVSEGDSGAGESSAGGGAGGSSAGGGAGGSSAVGGAGDRPSGAAGSGGAGTRRRRLCVHRKGATLALPPGHADLADDFRGSGQPVVVPGSMGTASWLLAGAAGKAFASTCHGAGRAQSRAQAKKTVHGGTLRDELTARGIAVRALSKPGLAEEAPTAYKDVDEVVRVCEEAGLSRRVARLRPLGVVKG